MQAAIALSRGHYHAIDSPDYAADCPQCRQRVTTQLAWRWRLARRGEPYSLDPAVLGGRPARFGQEAPREALVRALMEHLRGECQP